MDVAALTTALLTADDDAQAELISQHVPSRIVTLAREMHAAGQAAWNSEPMVAVRAASALRLLAAHTDDKETSALTAWMAGIAALVEGRMEAALAALNDAREHFDALGLLADAAATQVPTLMALGMLARYDEAIQAGLRARDQFIHVGDVLAAGKVELNLGHIYFRQDAYAAAEECYALARDHFAQITSDEWLIAAQIALADVSAWQHRFGVAASLYLQAEQRAEEAGLGVLQATSALNAGHLALLQGRYDHALRDLERAHRIYESLQLFTDVALCEQKIADAYLELNLIPEAITMYARVVPQFEQFDMPFEHAWGLTHYGRALLRAGRTEDARTALRHAHSLFVAQDNPICAAIATYGLAQVEFARENFDQVIALAQQAEPELNAGNWHSWLGMVRWLRAESARRLGDIEGSRAVLEMTLAGAGLLPQVGMRCLTSLGLIAKAEGRFDFARQHFQAAIDLVWEQRARLPAEDFQIAFVADKLKAFEELALLYLAANPPQVVEAISLVELWRARSLLETMQRGSRAVHHDPTGDDVQAQIDQLQDELNWVHGQLYLALSAHDMDSGRVQRLQILRQEREAAVLSLSRRQFHARDTSDDAAFGEFNHADLQRAIGPDTAVVAYVAVGEALFALVITTEHFKARRLPASMSQVETAVNQFRFQIETIRHGVDRLRAHLPQLVRRTQHHLRELHEALFAPLLPDLGTRRLIVVPDQVLHYVPFHALWDGRRYVIEEREVSVTPSASVLLECLSRTRRVPRHGVLFGVSDARAPYVREEVIALSPLFTSTRLLVDDKATAQALQAFAAEADVLHLACHAEFRPDAPLFSALHLTGGRLTVRDAYDLQLAGALVTLSACETGVSAIAPGNEIIGLVRGFFAAGAPTVVVSLWAVDDASTSSLMQAFYARVIAGERPSAALRAAQCQALREQAHPFFWAPFAVHGQS
jgi:CHAT domain-containing protein